MFAEDRDPIEHVDGRGDPLRGRELRLGEGASGLRELDIHGGVEGEPGGCFSDREQGALSIAEQWRLAPGGQDVE